jgi:hypothetical protein
MPWKPKSIKPIVQFQDLHEANLRSHLSLPILTHQYEPILGLTDVNEQNGKREEPLPLIELPVIGLPSNGITGIEKLTESPVGGVQLPVRGEESSRRDVAQYSPLWTRFSAFKAFGLDAMYSTEQPLPNNFAMRGVSIRDWNGFIKVSMEILFSILISLSFLFKDIHNAWCTNIVTPNAHAETRESAIIKVLQQWDERFARYHIKMVLCEETTVDHQVRLSMYAFDDREEPYVAFSDLPSVVMKLIVLPDSPPWEAK